MYRITHALSVGRFPTPGRAELLRNCGVTHLLNVSDAPPAVAEGPGGFRQVAWVPLTDYRRITDEQAVEALDTLHRMASADGALVYVHCVAGQNRAPTVLWLYLIACGYPAEYARELIERRSPDAIAGHPRLADDALAFHVQKHGLTHYLPLKRGEIVTPYDA